MAHCSWWKVLLKQLIHIFSPVVNLARSLDFLFLFFSSYLLFYVTVNNTA